VPTQHEAFGHHTAPHAKTLTKLSDSTDFARNFNLAQNAFLQRVGIPDFFLGDVQDPLRYAAASDHRRNAGVIHDGIYSR